MNRRTFAGALAGIAAARPMWPAGEPGRSQFFTMDRFELRQGTQPGRMNDWFKNSLIPRLAKVHTGPVIVLEASIAPHTPEMIFLAGYSSFEEIWSVQSKLRDAEMTSAWSKIEAGSEPPFEAETFSILETAPYSPPITTEKHEKPRYFELRTYHSPTASQLHALHERMAGPEGKIFHRSGIFPILYSSTLFGPNMPNLTYLIPFESLAAREKAWDAFGADPEWVKTRKESVDKYGQITAINNIAIYRATAYSPIA